MWLHWAQLGSFHMGFLTWLQSDSWLSWISKMAQSHGGWKTVAVNWVFSQEYCLEHLHLASPCVLGCSHQGDWFPRDITPRRTMQRDQLETSKLLLTWPWKSSNITTIYFLDSEFKGQPRFKKKKAQECRNTGKNN